MNNILIAFILLISSVGLAQNIDTYYWYKGEKRQIGELNPKKSFSLIDSIAYNNEVVKSKKQSLLLYRIESPKMNSEELNKPNNIRFYTICDSSVKKSSYVKFSIPSYKDKKGGDIIATDEFHVKLNSSKDYEYLKILTTKYNLDIVGNYNFLPDWYLVRCTENTKINPVSLANLFYETGKFNASEPVFMMDVEHDCPINPSDAYFGNQWNLENIGQNGGVAGVDIKYCGASQITKGISSVKIGLIDHGIERSHYDFFNPYANSQGYDMGTSSSPNLVDYNINGAYHGMSCAGIISAQNNVIGVVGIAPKCQLVPVSQNEEFQLSGGLINPTSYIGGLNYLFSQNVAVVSNSYHFITEFQGRPQMQAVENSLSHLMQNGRNGLGTLIVFSSGNGGYSSLSYPGNFHPDILTVGAINRCGFRVPMGINSCNSTATWGSQYGSELDVVAPGLDIPTLDFMGVNGKNATDYHLTFSGTSAAAPHVAALAGLMVSKNQYLTQKELANVIEKTCQKKGGYTFQNTAGRPNGTWHQEVGYGLINAEAALNTIACNLTQISNQVINSDLTISSCEVIITNSSLTTTGTDLIIKSKNLVINSIEIPLGTTFTTETLNY